MGSLTLASREKLDNLIFVVNCNLQRLDGPVRGNGKIVQEFEAAFRGAGWNVIKVIWGTDWDALLERDYTGCWKTHGRVVDGECQTFITGRRVIRKNFSAVIRNCSTCGASERRRLYRLRRGGHDPIKVFNAYKAAYGAHGWPRSSWRRPSRATAWAKRAKAATSHISRRS